MEYNLKLENRILGIFLPCALTSAPSNISVGSIDVPVPSPLPEPPEHEAKKGSIEVGERGGGGIPALDGSKPGKNKT